MHYLLFTFYLAIACLFIYRNRFIKSTGLPAAVMMGLFLAKIAAGVLAGCMFAKYYPQGNDYWDLNDFGIIEYQVLINDPKTFFTTIFNSFFYNYNEQGFFGAASTFCIYLKPRFCSRTIH